MATQADHEAAVQLWREIVDGRRKRPKEEVIADALAAAREEGERQGLLRAAAFVLEPYTPPGLSENPEGRAKFYQTHIRHAWIQAQHHFGDKLRALAEESGS